MNRCEHQRRQAVRSLSPLCEMAAGLFWKPLTRALFMLWGYLDESGEHSNGRLVRLTVAGCMSPLEAWQQFEEEWGAILASHGIDKLHMNELASKKAGFYSPYRGWTQDKKDSFLGKLVAVMGRHVQYYVGVKIPHEKPDTATRKAYAAGVTNMIAQTCMTAGAYAGDDEGASLVFASHPEVKESALGYYCDQIRVAIPNLGSVSMMQPDKCAPLQAADLFAYEFSHCQDWHNIGSLSPSLTKLRSGTASFMVSTQYMYG